MNKVVVEGGNKKQRAEVEAVVNWMISELMPRHRTLDIYVTLRDTLNKDGVLGWCLPETNREFDLDIHKKVSDYDKGKEDFVKTIIHEMVHVWQYATGTLKQTSGRKLFWKKKDYSDAPYEDQPWELEAHNMEDELYIGWLNDAI